MYLLPRFIPSLVAVYAMITIIRDSGVLNRISLLMGGNFKPALMYHASGLIIMNLWFNIPFAALMITAGLGGIPDSIIESARDVGATKMRVLRSMIIPAFGQGRYHCFNLCVHEQCRCCNPLPDRRKFTEDARN